MGLTFPANYLAAKGNAMIIGSHVIIYSRDAQADRSFLQKVLKFPHVDVGGGWLIFGLPPAEVAFHPAEHEQGHEFYLMCENVEAFIRVMQKHAIECSPVKTERWGLLTEVTLPGGGKLGVYEPRHARPKFAATEAQRATKRIKLSAARKSKKKTPSAARRKRF
jgi:hypothetical protein